MTNPAPEFPILNTTPRQYIPWNVITPHRQRIERHHGQTLERLSERGGLSPDELDYHHVPNWRDHAHHRTIRT